MAKKLSRKSGIWPCFFVMLLIVLIPVEGAVETGVMNNSSGDLQNSEVSDKSGRSLLEEISKEGNSSLEGDVTAQDNTCSEARSSNLGVKYSWYIDYAGDVDWHKWSIPSNGKFTAKLDVPFTKDYELEVYTSCGTRVCSSTSIIGFDEECVVDVGSGVVYAKVYGHNNAYSTSSTYGITGTFQPTTSYDLTYGEFTITPSSPYDTDEIAIKYRFKNQGTGAITKYFNSRLYIDDEIYQTCYAGESIAIEPGVVYACERSGIKLLAGEHTIRQAIDEDNNIKETNENNNVKTQTQVVNKKAKKYDIIADRFIISPSSPYDSSAITIKPVVRNSGPDSITNGFNYKFYIDSSLYPVCEFYNGLNSGYESGCEYSNIHLASGTHTLKLSADSENKVLETNEGNNVKEYTLSVKHDTSQDYDLVVTDIFTEPASIQGGQEFTLKFTVDNIKPTSINKQFVNRLYINNGLVIDCLPTDLQDGYIVLCSKPGVALAAGTYTLKAVADSGNNVAEVNEGNNERTETLVVSQAVLPDIVITNLWTEPASLVAGGKFAVKYSLANTASTATTKSFTSRLYINEQNYGGCSHGSGLVKGMVYNCDVNDIALATGTYTLKAVADVNNDIAESSEGNNFRTKSSVVADKPCPVPDGSSLSCDCDYNSECPSSYPYCEEEYPSPISDGYDGCLARQPLYCGDNLCNNEETWQSCGRDCGAPAGRIYTTVKSPANYPLSGAQVYLDNEFKVSTTKLGKIDFSASYGNRNVKVNCPDGSYCSSKSVYVNGNAYVNFQCECGANQDGELNVYVYNQNKYPIVNVIGYLDGKEIGLSTPFGLIRKEGVSYGSHNLRLELYISNPVKLGTLYKTISIDEEKNIEEIILRESDLQLKDTGYSLDSRGNVISTNNSEQVVALIPIAMAIVDIASVGYSATEFCKCAYGTDELTGGALECFNTFNSCGVIGMNVNQCIDGVKKFSAAQDKCFWEAAFLVGDIASPFIPVGVVGGIIIKTGRKFSWVDNAFRFVGKNLDGLWKYTKKLGDNTITFFAKVIGKEGVERSIEIGGKIFLWGDEAVEGIEKIITKGGQKAAKGLIEALGEEAAEKLSKNIGKLSKKGVKGSERVVKSIATNSEGFGEASLRLAKETDPKEIEKIRSSLDGYLSNINGRAFESEIAASPKYIDNVEEMLKPLQKSRGDIDILLKDGTMIDAKGGSSFGLRELNDISQEPRKFILENPDGKIKFIFKNEPTEAVKNVLNQLKQEYVGKIEWEVFQ